MMKRMACFAGLLFLGAQASASVVGPIDFDSKDVQLYEGGQNSDSATYTTSGNQLTLTDNIWVAVDIGSLTLTSNMQLKFDFSSTVQGELQGIILDDDLIWNTSGNGYVFGERLWGTQTNDPLFNEGVAGNDYTGGTQSFTLDLGALAGETVNYIAFVMDDDSVNASSSNSTFSNVSIQAVPVPAALPLFATAIVGVGAARLRRRSK